MCFTGTSFNNVTRTVALQSDGKIVVGGDFTTYNGTTRNRVVRTTTTGALDTSYSIGTGANNSVRTLLIQSGDSKVVIGGEFTAYNGSVRNSVARINANGSIDTSFTRTDSAALGISLVKDIGIQTDGKILVVGAVYISGTSFGVARLNTNGTYDATFDIGAGLTASSGDLSSEAVAIQSNNKTIVGGTFTHYRGTARKNLVRINSDGVVDGSFSIGSGFNYAVFKIAIQPDGKILVGGEFTTVNGVTRNNIARLNSNGSVDTGFTSPLVGWVLAIKPQADGKILVGGDFTGGLKRLNANGTVDTTFSGTSFNGRVSDIEIQADGRIVVVGSFTAFGATSRSRIARLSADGILEGCPCVPPVGTSSTGTTICSGTAFSFNPQTKVGVTCTFTWTADYGGLTGGAGSGTGTISETLTNATPNTINAVYHITPTSLAGCIGSPFTYVKPIKPKPIGTNSSVSTGSADAFSINPQTYVNVLGSTFSWTATYASGLTGGVGSGTGNITETLFNFNFTPRNAVYTITPTANGCVGTAFTITVSVGNCHAPTGTTTGVTVSSNIEFTINPLDYINPTGTTFTWIASYPSGLTGGLGAGSGTIVETIDNTTPSPQNIIYTITPSLGSCIGYPFNIVATIGIRAPITLTIYHDSTTADDNLVDRNVSIHWEFDGICEDNTYSLFKSYDNIFFFPVDTLTGTTYRDEERFLDCQTCTRLYYYVTTDCFYEIVSNVLEVVIEPVKSKWNLGGIKKLWIAPKPTGLTYVVMESTYKTIEFYGNNIMTVFEFNSILEWYELPVSYECNYRQKMSISKQGYTFGEVLEVEIPKLNPVKWQGISDLLGDNLVVVFETNNGDYCVMGYDAPAQIQTYEATTEDSKYNFSIEVRHNYNLLKFISSYYVTNYIL